MRPVRRLCGRQPRDLVPDDGPGSLDAGPDEHRRALALLVAALSGRAHSDWDLYAAHRARLTREIVESAQKEKGRLCLLGAGNCNDVDLERLAETFREIHLVDVDDKALMRAVARQPADVRAKLRRHGGVDLAGLSPRRLARWKRAAPDADEIEDAAASALERILTELEGACGGPFDVVASTCVLTQMAFALREALGERHPALEPARLALMRTHLSTMLSMTAPGGTVLFVSDVVSSTAYPLDLPQDAELGHVLRDVVQGGTGYFAANPEIIAGLLAEVGTPTLVEPWLWTGPLARTYLVYALRLRIGADAQQ